MGSVLAPFCGDRRAGAACGADARGTVRFFAGDVVVDSGRSFRRMCAGFCDSVLLDPAEREIARRNGAPGSREAWRLYRTTGGARDFGDFAGGGGAGRRECVEDLAVG